MNRQAQIEAFTLAAHRLAVLRLREQPHCVEAARAVLHRWREQSGPSRSDRYWDTWEQLLAQGVEALEQAVCVHSDEAAVLRSVSPLGVLLTQKERGELLQQCRHPA